MDRKCAFPQDGQLRVAHHGRLKCFNECFAVYSIYRIRRFDYREYPNIKDLGFGLRVFDSGRFPDVQLQVFPRLGRNANRASYGRVSLPPSDQLASKKMRD